MHTARLQSVMEVSGEMHVLHVSETIIGKELDSPPPLCGLSVQFCTVWTDSPYIVGVANNQVNKEAILGVQISVIYWPR